MPRGKGRPTKVVRLYADDVEAIAVRAAAARTTAAEVVHGLVTRKPIVAKPTMHVPPRGRCSCASPTLSKTASNICTTCGCLR